MPEITDAATRMCILKAIGKSLGIAENESKAEALDRMAYTGSTQGHGMLGTTRIGTVSFVVPEPSASVVDHDALVTWLREHNPNALVPRTVTEIRPEFMGALQNVDGAAVTPDGEPVDGVKFASGKPYVSVRVTPDQVKIILDAIAPRDHKPPAINAVAMLGLPAVTA